MHSANYPAKVRDTRKLWRFDRQDLIAKADTLLGIKPKTRIVKRPTERLIMGNVYAAPVWITRPIDPTVKAIVPWVK